MPDTSYSLFVTRTSPEWTLVQYYYRIVQCNKAGWQKKKND